MNNAYKSAFHGIWHIVKEKVAQLCLTLCDLKDYTVHGILQATILEWVAVLFSRGSSQPRDQPQVSHIAEGFFTGWVTRAKSKCSLNVSGFTSFLCPLLYPSSLCLESSPPFFSFDLLESADGFLASNPLLSETGKCSGKTWWHWWKHRLDLVFWLWRLKFMILPLPPLGYAKEF